MKRFRCIGETCEDSCCKGWRVDIDKETYQKYRKIKGSNLANLLEKNVTRNRSNGSNTRYAKIKLDAEQSCPLLDEKGLCQIHTEYGEEYLSEVCKTYPRMINRVNGVWEQSLTVSCPQAARLVLLNKEKMSFDQTVESVDGVNMLKKDINADDMKLSGTINRYFWELRVFSISLIQNRDYKIWERLVILGLFYNKLQELIDSKQIEIVPELIARYSIYIEQGAFKNELNNIPVEYAVQMKLIKEIADRRYLQGISNERYRQCFKEFLEGINYDNESKEEEIAIRYQEAYSTYYKPFMDENEYIWENYLVNYMFKNMFPIQDLRHVFESYMVMIIHYAMIKMNLIGVAAYHKELTTEIVIKVVQSFAKTVEHNDTYVSEIKKLMVVNQMNSLGYMVILIKNE